MKKIYCAFALLCLCLITACKDKDATTEKTDNLFKFREYISFHTQGRTSIAKPIRIDLAQPLEQFEITQEIPSEYIKVTPPTKGKLLIENSTTLLFKPENYLAPDTEYTVKLALDELYDDVKDGFETFAFSFKTIQPNFKINLGNLQSYSKEWQYVTGTLEASDLIQLKNAKKILEAQQDGKNLKISWPEEAADANYFTFTIDSIQRHIDDSQVEISWDGKPIKADNTGKNTFPIPGQNNFTVIDLRSSLGEQSSISINFSDPLKEDQNFKGLVNIENQNQLRFEVDGNVLHVYPSNRITGTLKVDIFKGIKNNYGFNLKKDFSETVSFQQIKPAVRLLSKGVILPNSEQTPIYFESVNLSAVDVRVIKIYEDNMLQFLQNANLHEENSYDIRRVGRRVAKKTIPIKTNSDFELNSWKAHALNISEFIKADPGAMYQVEISFKKAYSTFDCGNEAESNEIVQDQEEDYYEEEYDNASYITDEEEREEKYWDNEIYNWRESSYNWEERDNPCSNSYYREHRFAVTNVLGSDLGFIVKESNNRSYHFATTNLLSATAEPGVTVEIYNYQQQLIASITTDKDGFAIIDSDKKAAFAIAHKGKNYAYAKLDDGNALSLSKFDVSGKILEKGLKGFLYTERGVHRPGDTIHLTFALNDQANPLPKNHPIKLEVTDARGKLVKQQILVEGEFSPSGGARGGFYYFPITTQDNDPTGNWNATVYVGGASFSKNLKVATVKPNRLKIKLDFDDKILDASKPIAGNLSATWLHGAPARNLKAEMEVTLTSTSSAFDKFSQYDFIDPVRSFDKIEMPLLETQLSSTGEASFSKKIDLNKKAPGMLKATFLTKVFEGGGDFSIDVFSKNLAPYDYFVGLLAPEPHRYGSYYTDENTVFDVVSVDAQGEVSGNRELEVKVFEIEWRWWWSRGRDNLSRYENTNTYRPVKDFTVSTGTNGRGQFTLNIPERNGGRYLIRVIDKASGHATGKTVYFYRNWWKRPSDADAESAKMLVFSADKEKYKVGEDAVITFPSGSKGRALISIENGTEVLSKQWVETQKGETQVSIPLTQEMAPNVYVNISLLQPQAQTKNDLPIRLYGVIPLMVENPKTKLQPNIEIPEVLKPEEHYTVKVMEAQNREMTYTLAVVDEGLLDLTRYTTPDIHAAFYAREALGVKTFDIFDDVIGAYSGSVDNIYEIGGGDAAAGAKNRKADRFKPVVTYLGPFHLKAGESKTHRLFMPNYVGSVKTMVVAGNHSTSAYGSAEKVTPVRKPLMVLASLPRKLSPGEKVTLPVTVFAMEKQVKNVKVEVKADEAFTAIGETSKNISFNEVGEQIVNFEFEVNATNQPQTFQIYASGNGEKAKTFVEIDVENPNPITQKSTTYTLENEQNQTIDLSTFGVEGSNAASVEFSTLPPMDFSKRMEYLIHYPHGCIEQTTSGAFPQLFMGDIFDLSFSKKQEIEENVKHAINRLNNFQTTSGGLSYWPGNSEADEWGTNYAGHFMLEAKKKGYALPITFLSNWIRYQQNEARQWRNSRTHYNSSLTQAYRLYTLALAGQPELAAMNRLRESGEMSNDAKWRLAAAYALVGKENVAKDIVSTANINFKTKDYNYYTYGSPFRNKAMALETMVLLGDQQQRELAISLAKNLSSSSWYSTQETSYALLALAKMANKNGGKAVEVKYSLNGNSESIKTTKALAERNLAIKMGTNQLTLENQKNNILYVTVSQSGKLPLGEELTEQSKLSVKTQFVDGGGNALDISELRQGTEVIAKVSVTNTSMDRVDNIALSQIFPSGWEVVNTSFTDLAGGADGEADYKDIRDDRVNFYFELDSKKTKVFSVKLNASYLGTYYLPGTQAEAMYDNTYFARTQGKWVKIVK
ncbi:alpha-2-macroglobulin family protein [Zunongwangia pacifica]|uniref:MG2 domain-containing protein n=1 Tax=Zunongwangia pacifica TaxID=2911062 RepID=A0A9X1ZPX8_9FLAO|nr:MG2 domain-containing protein [Zunongwangia pacifica]MCL6217956.1 MG2 domain-containing protein [Zunongwangia pacifica]